MESVVATVSGYHGKERFEVIKLIEHCGAYYVPAMNRSITHLVCWEFKGKKYDLARKLKTHIISHLWFVDCLKQGRRLPEGPYTMQSGEEVGPILWKVPSIREGHVNDRTFHFGERNAEANHCKASQSAKGKEIDFELSNWSDSHLLKEKSFCGWDAKKRLSNSKACRKSKGVLRKSHPYNKHQIATVDDPCSWPESSSRSSTRLKRRRNFYDDAIDDTIDDTYSGPTGAVKIREHNHDYPRSQSSSPSFEMVPESIFSENEENRKMNDEDDMKERSECPYLVDSNSCERFHLLTAEANPKVMNSVEIKTLTDLCDSGECRVDGKSCDGLSVPSAQDEQKELSCVICWTDFCSSRGVLPCGHCFCYSCIQEWADCMVARGKTPTCPLCKANFSSITKSENLISSEQKIFLQTIPCNSSKVHIFCRPDSSYDTFRAPHSDSVCFECQRREPEDLLLSCNVCRSRRVHSCCLDPPLIPWTCIHCRDLRMLYQRFR